jgi:hypothetical protein
MDIESIIGNVVIPIASVVGAAFLSYKVAKWQLLRTYRDADYQRAYEAVREATDRYLEWLIRFRFFVDPFDRRRLRGVVDQAKLGVIAQYLDVVERLEADGDAGTGMIDSLEEAGFHLVIVDDAFLGTLRALVSSISDHWRELAQSGPDERNNGRDTMTWILGRDAMEMGELEAMEVFRAEGVINDLRLYLRRDHDRRLHGSKVDKAVPSSGPLRLEGKHLRYDGPIPFRSPEYLALRDLPPWERRDQPDTSGQGPA